MTTAPRPTPEPAASADTTYQPEPVNDAVRSLEINAWPRAAGPSFNEPRGPAASAKPRGLYAHEGVLYEDHGDGQAEPAASAMPPVTLQTAIEREMKHATFFRFDGDGQFGGWQECERGTPGAVAMFTRHDIEKIVAALQSAALPESPEPPALPEQCTYALFAGPQSSEYRMLSQEWDSGSAKYSGKQMRDFWKAGYKHGAALPESPEPPALLETMTLQEVWEAAGGNPGIKPSRAEVIEALRQLDAVCEEASRAPGGEAYDDLFNALHRIDTIAHTLPTFTVRHEGGLQAFVDNIVDAIEAAASR